MSEYRYSKSAGLVADAWVSRERIPRDRCRSCGKPLRHWGDLYCSLGCAPGVVNAGAVAHEQGLTGGHGAICGARSGAGALRD